jgi:hypothetical protein
MGKFRIGGGSRGGSNGGSNGGIAGSGIFAMFGTTVHCKSEDNSIYCSIMKLFNMLIVLVIFIVIIYYIYHFISSYKFTKKGR